MPEEAKPQGTLDPTQLWKQWQDGISNIWANVLDGIPGASLDPYGPYRNWLKSITEAQAQAQSIAHLMDPKEAWKLWFEHTREAWKKVAELGADPLGLTTQWVEMLEAARARVLAGETTPTDAFPLLKQWYDATNESWAKEVGNLFASDQFMEAVRQFLESYTGFTKMIRRANEEYFRSLQLPTRSDIARVAELVIAVEEKVDRLDDTFADFKDAPAQVARDKAVNSIQELLVQVESSIKLLSPALEKLQTLDRLARRLDQLASHFDLLPLTLEKVQAFEGLTQRLDQLERKLDAALSAIEQNERKAQPTPPALAGAAPRQSARKTSAHPATATPAAEKK